MSRMPVDGSAVVGTLCPSFLPQLGAHNDERDARAWSVDARAQRLTQRPLSARVCRP